MNPLTLKEALETPISEFAAILLDAAMKGVVVLAIALLAVRCMKRRSAAARHLVLSLAVASLLLLPLLASTLPPWKLLPRWMGSASTTVESQGEVRSASWPTETQFVTTAKSTERIDYRDFPSVLLGAAKRESVLPVSRAGSLSVNAPESRRVEWGLAVWLAGVFCSAVPVIAGLFSLRRLRRTARAVDSGPLRQILEEVAARIVLRRRVLLLTAEDRWMPMTWGVFRPTVLLPEMSAAWPEARQRIVLLHELVHVQRCDFLANLIAQFACAFHWFNPLVWLAARRIGCEREQACDDVVLRKGTKPAGYAEEVLRLAAQPSLRGLEAFGALAMARPSSLEGRLLAILDGTRDRTSPTGLGIMIVALLMGSAIIPVSMLRAEQGSANTSPAAVPAAASSARDGGAGDLTPGLVAWWRGDGNGKDSAGKHDGTFPFGEAYAPGLVGGAFDFRRSYAIADQLARVSIPDSPDFQFSEELTLEAWIYPETYGGIVLLRGDDRGGYDAWQVDLMTHGQISYGFNAADNQATAIHAPIQLHQWQHVAVTFDHGLMRLYVNGILMTQASTELRPIAVLDPKYNPALGIGNAGGKFYNMPFDGMIDEVRIYNRALSEAEIGERMKK